MKKIVVIGPESTGKSTLCKELAVYYKTNWCPEFAREYLKETSGSYQYSDLLNIAQGQIMLEEKLISSAKNDYYFIDTDMYVMKVWCEVAFEQCHNWILKQIALRRYDLYLLCNTDLPWIHDDLREYPDPEFRKKLFSMYKDIMVNSGTRWAEISGTNMDRTANAIRLIERYVS